MGSNYQNLTNLNTSTESPIIRARISRVWPSINLHNNEIFGLNMLLIDEEGNQKAAFVEKRWMKRFKDKMIESLIIEIKNFDVKSEQRRFQVIKEKCYIQFRGDTKVNPLNDPESQIPKYKFSFVDFDDIPSYEGNDTYLLDVIGTLCQISNPKEVMKHGGKKSIKREISISNKRGKMMDVTLWGDIVDDVNEDIVKAHGNKLVIIVTLGLVKKFGNYYLSTSGASKVYLNLEIPEVAELLENATAMPEQTIEFLNRKDAIVEKEIQKLTIKELLPELKIPDNKGVKFNCQATIRKVYEEFGWSYTSCPTCKKKVEKEDDYWCDKCEKEVSYPIERLKLTMQVEDDTGVADLVAFEKEVEYMLNYTNTELAEMASQENGKAKVTLMIEKIIGKELYFQTRISEYDIYKGGKKITASRIHKVIGYLGSSINVNGIKSEEKVQEVGYVVGDTRKIKEEENHGKECSATKKICLSRD